MGFSSKKQSQISYKTIYLLALCLCRSSGVIDYEIYRSERDIFAIPHDGSEDSCSIYDAECIDNDNCDYCRCLEGKNTLIINDDDILECVGDEEIVLELGIYVYLTHIVHMHCVKALRPNFSEANFITNLLYNI